MEYKIFIALCVCIISICAFVIKETNEIGFITKNDGSIYYKNEDHDYLYGLNTIEGNTYYFDEDTGEMIVGMFIDEENTYYFNELGIMVKGLNNIDGTTYYFDEKTGALVTNSYKTVNDKILYFDDEGIMVTGKYQDSLFDDTGNLIVDRDYLEEKLEDIISSYSGDISLYFKDLRTDQSISINDHEFYSYSMIKVPAMVAVFNAIYNGDIEDSEEIQNYLSLMISISDNTSFNELMIILGDGDEIKGIDIMSELMEEYGLTNTYANHGLLPGSDYVTRDGDNKTTASDIGKLLELIYNKEIVDEKSCDEMIDLLLTNTDDTELKQGLDEDTLFAHKTGYANASYHDGGIIFNDCDDYILVVFSDETDHQSMMKEVSSFIFEYMSELY